MILEGVAAVLAGYGALVGAVYAVQRRLIYLPPAKIPARAAHGAEDMALVRYPTADGLVLTGWYRPARAGRPTLVYFHGNAGHFGWPAQRTQRYRQAGYGVLLAGYRGYGGNPGRPSESGLFDDARAARAWLAGQGVSAEHMVLYGESLGSGVAVFLAAETAVAGLVLEAPYTSIAEVAAIRFPFLPARRLTRDRFDSLTRIGQVRAPLLVMHGERDRTVPVRLGRRLYEAASGPKRAAFLPLAGHCDLYDHGAAGIVLEFLDALPSPATAMPANSTAGASSG